jgi:hypothetical protein
MDRGTFMASAMLGLVVAMAIFFPLGAKRRASIPSLVLWFCLVAGGVTCMYGLSHSTAPSFAPRITATGKAYDCEERKQGRDSKFVFSFVPDEGDQVNIETRIAVPGWARPERFNGRTLRVVYLRDAHRSLSNEAIDIRILSGDGVGFHDFLDTRPGGVWLGVPIGAALASFGFFGLKYMKDDEIAAASEDDDSAS